MLGIVKELAALALVALVALNCVRGAESVAPVDDPAGPELSATEEAPSQATIAGFVVDEASGEGVEGVRRPAAAIPSPSRSSRTTSSRAASSRASTSSIAAIPTPTFRLPAAR
ncbi:MAG: hypothetical protein H6711_33160 [Myxococcales bacterium]|nr:hypothetical protein [Myxococcales bacterium]